MTQPSSRWAATAVLSTAVFLNTFSWGFAQVSLPFYVRAISNGDIAQTLRWTGWIMGITPLLVVCTTPLWIRWARRWDPRTSFAVADILQGAAFVVLAAVDTVLGVFGSRVFLGLGGPANTFAFMIAGRSDGKTEWTISTMHSAVTTGILLAPLAGAFAAVYFGYGPSFVMAAIILCASALLVRLAIPVATRDGRPGGDKVRISWREISSVCLLNLVGYSQVVFLNSVLPEVLPRLGIAQGKALEVGGWILFASSVTLAAGALPAPVLMTRYGESRTLVYGLALSCGALALLALATTIWQFTALWLVHILFVAPVFPVITARVVGWSNGQALGALNSARVAANFLGPVLATTLLSWFAAPTAFVLLAILGIACLPVAVQPPKPALAPAPGS